MKKKKIELLTPFTINEEDLPKIAADRMKELEKYAKRLQKIIDRRDKTITKQHTKIENYEQHLNAANEIINIAENIIEYIRKNEGSDPRSWNYGRSYGEDY